jgi:DNA-binding NarL/FixJ family response regulator
MAPRDCLSAREEEVAVLVWQGFTNPEIAMAIGTTEQVMKNHVGKIFDKLGVWSRLELALYVAAHGGAEWNRQASTGSACNGDGRKATETMVRVV